MPPTEPGHAHARLYRVVCAALLVAAAGIAAAGFAANAGFYHDDAFIGLRYARNLIAGRGLVWNPGERVEGYTNGLFTILEATLGAAGVDLVAASRAINILAFLALALFLWLRRSRRGGPGAEDSALRLVPLALVLTSFPLIVWTLGGLEGPFFAALIAMAAWLVMESLGRSAAGGSLAVGGLLFGLACATRMDGLLLVATSAVLLVVDSRESRTRRLATFTLPAAAACLPFYVGRLVYYGALVPNTYWVKAAGAGWSRVPMGFGYVTAWAMTPPFLPLLAIPALLVAARRRALDRGMAYLLCLIVVHLSYVIHVGGDSMPAFRLLLPAIPLSALLLGTTLTRLLPGGDRRAGAAVLLCLLVLAGFQTIDQRVNPRQMDPAAWAGTIVGKRIAGRWRPGSLVALSTAGSTPFYAPDLRFIDMLGLNDAHIARRPVTDIQLPWQAVPGHLKGDGEYVLRRRPDYIVVGPAEGATIQEPWFLSDLELARNPEFPASYTLRQEYLDVSQFGGFREYDTTRTGILTFTYYQRTADGP